MVVITSSLLLASILFSSFFNVYLPQEINLQSDCEPLGWFPEDFGLKDHSIFWYQGAYYLVSIYIPGEKQFAYGRSDDLCEWEDLSPVLADRIPESWDSKLIWSPFVLEDDGKFYMYYTGVSKGMTQSIMLATTDNPADPDSWTPQGMIFQPNHPGMIWEAGRWSDCRDPFVIKNGDTYYLLYTGRDHDGGIVGLATSSNPAGPWLDWGTIIAPLADQAIPESPSLAVYDSIYYLFYNHTGRGEVVRVGASLAGPWSGGHGFSPGWAHEVWQSPGGDWFSSFLTDYTVTISPLVWDEFFNPPEPFLGSQVTHQLLPAILR